MLYVYARPGCLFCQQVSDLLTEAGVEHVKRMIVDVDEQQRLVEAAGARSFPLVFRDEEYIGGFTHILHLHSHNRLQSLNESDSMTHRDSTLPTTPVEAGETQPPPRISATDTVRQHLAGFAAWNKYKGN